MYDIRKNPKPGKTGISSAGLAIGYIGYLPSAPMVNLARAGNLPRPVVNLGHPRMTGKGAPGGPVSLGMSQYLCPHSVPNTAAH